jgi:hypothetical protein
VPGTEDYLLDDEESGEASDGQRCKLRNELMRGTSLLANIFVLSSNVLAESLTFLLLLVSL